MPKGKGKQSKGRRPETLAKMAFVLEKRRDLTPFTQIAAELGCSYKYAYDLFQMAMEDARADLNETARGVVALELMRLDEMQRRLWPHLPRDDRPPLEEELQVLDRVLKVMDRRSKLLGLDKITVVGAPGVPASGDAGRIDTSNDDVLRQYERAALAIPDAIETTAEVG